MALSGDQTTYYLSDFIGYKSDSNLNYYNFTILAKSDDSKLFFTIKNVLDDYMDELTELSVECTLSDEEVIKYKYKPWLLAYDIYGNTELYFIILFLNNLFDTSEFEDIKTLKLLKSATLTEALNKIFNSESSFIQNNREEVLQ